jgi:hypothetical protein
MHDVFVSDGRERERENIPWPSFLQFLLPLPPKHWFSLSKLWRPKVYRRLPLDPSFLRASPTRRDTVPPSFKDEAPPIFALTVHLTSTRNTRAHHTIGYCSAEATLEISRSRFPGRMRGSTMTRNGAAAWCRAEYDVWTPKHTVDTVHHHRRNRIPQQFQRL